MQGISGAPYPHTVVPRTLPKPFKERAMPAPTPLLSRTRNPLHRLERLPGWWLGKAETRRMLARDAREQRQDAQADEHMRVAIAYERRATALVVS